METMGDRIRRLRTAKGIERKDLARDVGFSYTGLSDLESGKARSTSKLHRLASALGVTANYLETGRHDVVRDEPATYSQAVRLDGEMILDVFRSLQEVFQEIGLEYRVEEHPGLFAEFLADCMSEQDIHSATAKAKVGKWLRKGGRQGAEDERAAEVPTTGTDTRKAGGSKAKG